MLNACDLVGWW